MILKYFTIAIFSIGLLSGCAQTASLLGPGYTLATTGNVTHAGLTYGTSSLIKDTTGKSVTQNIKDMLTPKKKTKLVEENNEETRKRIKFFNQ